VKKNVLLFIPWSTARIVCLYLPGHTCEILIQGYLAVVVGDVGYALITRSITGIQTVQNIL